METNAVRGRDFIKPVKVGQETTAQDLIKDILDIRGNLAPVRPEDRLNAEPPGGTARPSDGVQTLPGHPIRRQDTEGKYNGSKY